MTAATSTSFPHWRCETDSNAIVRVLFDTDDSRVNKFSRETMDGLASVITELETLKGIRGVIFASAKRTGFIVGADIGEFDDIETAEQGARLASDGQSLFARIEGLSVPTVAAIDGFALGGGLELALACTYRIAVEGYERNLGLPEVNLGIHPGFGGTVRAVRVLGPVKALDMMLTGRSMSPVEALEAGLVDRVVKQADLDSSCVDILKQKPRPQRAALSQRLLNWAPLRRYIAGKMRAQVARRARKDHYPAPYALTDLWQTYGGTGSAAYSAEAASIGKLFVSQTCRNLVRVFRLQERLKGLSKGDAGIQHVHVIGAGIMGGDIASWCALKGLNVTVQDQQQKAIDTAIERGKELFGKRLKAPGAADKAAARLHSDPDGGGAGKSDLVIEAVVERLDVKKSVFAELEEKTSDSTLLTSNTSSLMIEDMAQSMRVPGRFLGLHFFNPVAKLQLVEVVHGEQTDAAAMDRVISFVTRIGKLPLPCRSAPGFVVNRVLTPYMFEALRAHQDGYKLEDIDEAALDFGMPVGPIELADRVGLDVALHVAEVLADTLRASPPDLLRQMVNDGKLGAKTSYGFYVYEDGKAKKPGRGQIPDSELQDRIMLPLLNEAVACLSEGVIEEADLLDAGVIFGTGFAPFRGGPLHYAKERGTQAIVERLSELAEKHGERFLPHDGWSRIR